MRKARFGGGRLVATPGVVEGIEREEVWEALERHFSGDWGDCTPHDWQANEDALKEGARIFSVYHSRQGVKFWVITEADRSSTCVLLPEEY